MKMLPSAIIAVVWLVLSSTPLHAYERLQGPAEVLYWDKTRAYAGYTFFGVRSNTYLIDMEGRVAHTWPVGTNPHLLDNGNVLDASGGDVNGFSGLKEVDWSGNVVWQHTEPRANYRPHHDFLRIYNPKLGANTTLYIAAKSVSSDACIAAGCNPANGPYTNAQVDAIVEVDLSGNVVWEWYFFDHGIQDIDASKANYVGAGKTIANYPGRLNLNLPGRPVTNDWLQCNSIVEINGYLNASTNDTKAYVSPPTAGYNTWAPPGHDTDKRNKSMSRQIVWMYYSMANQGMFSHLDSGVQRLPNGDTLICDFFVLQLFLCRLFLSPVSFGGSSSAELPAWLTY